MKHIKTYEDKKTKFNKNDIVVCIDYSFYKNRLTINKTYKVRNATIHQIEIKTKFGSVGFWNNDRFRLATTEEANEHEAKLAANKYNL